MKSRFLDTLFTLVNYLCALLVWLSAQTLFAVNFGTVVSPDGTLYIADGHYSDSKLNKMNIFSFKLDGSVNHDFGISGVKTIDFPLDMEPHLVLSAKGELLIVGQYLQSQSETQSIRFAWSDVGTPGTLKFKSQHLTFIKGDRKYSSDNPPIFPSNGRTGVSANYEFIRF